MRTDKNKNEKPLKIPKLREGITLVFSDYDLAGQPQWMIHDPGRNKFFIIGWNEYEILKRWNLDDADAIINAVNEETTLNVDKNDIENLLRFLSHHFLIQQSGYQIHETAKSQKLFKKDSYIQWLISYYLFFKIPLCHPDRFLIKTKWIADIVFSRITFYIMLIAGIVALYQLSTQWEKFIHTFPTILNWQGFFFSLIAYLICKFCHELGHAYMCRRYGIPVPALGVAFLVFWPVLYTDTTLSWSLNSYKRMRIALAGIWVETYVTIIAALIWCNVQNLTVQTICYITITINWLASLLINVSPFMRFDGYYILADFLKMPNLQPRAFALTRWQIRRWLFHWPDPKPETFSPGMHHFLVAYSITTWIYRLFIYFGIALLVYHFFIKIVGILLFAIELFYFILGPIFAEVQVLFLNKAKFTLNLRTKITIIAAMALLFLFFIPTSETIKFPGTLSYDHEFLIAPTESILVTALPAIGTKIAANQPIIKLKSPEINNSIQEIQLNYEKQVKQLRRAAIDKKYIQQRETLESDLNKGRAEYKKLINLYSKLTLSVPFNGQVADVAYEVRPGTVVMKGEWLVDVVNPTSIKAEGYVSQVDFNLLRVGMHGYFYPYDLGEAAVPVKVKSIEVINSSKLNCGYSFSVKQVKNQESVIDTPCYNASDLGGDIATLFSDEGEYVPIDSIFRVVLITEKPIKLKHIERGMLFIQTQPNSLAYNFFYKLKTIWIQQSGF